MGRLALRLLLAVAVVVAGLAAWAWQFTRPDPVRWTVPIRAAGITWHVPAITAIRLATTPASGRLLDGRGIVTRHGRILLRRHATDGSLQLRCAPCRLDAPMVSTRALEVAEVTFAVRRHGARLHGEVRIGDPGASLAGRWQARIDRETLHVELEIAESPAAAFYGIFGAAIPENAHARIEGRFALRMHLRLPDGDLRLEPELHVDRVDGLGTAALRGASPTPDCGLTAARGATARPPRALVAAVLAAEDQRFYEHRGYDPAEIAAALALNTRRRAPARGASTLTQQLAKVLFVGAERTHVRKLRELLYAVEMERTLGKAQILRLYLQIAPWGEGVCGAEAAARRYFGRPIASLTLAQAASLAGLLRNPERELRDPAAHLERARRIAAGMTGVRGSREVGADQIAAAYAP